MAGQVVREGHLRVSMHPGQYTVLNSPRQTVVENSIAELVYHARLLDALGTGASHKIILHAGGVYGDKTASMQRFASIVERLPHAVQRRLVLENDETNYSLADVLSLSTSTGLPVVFDVFHHDWNPSFEGETLLGLIERAGNTWQPATVARSCTILTSGSVNRPAHMPLQSILMRLRLSITRCKGARWILCLR
jgi:UV DNA damage endonuclease